jgi:hypothetical protein
LPSFTLHAAGNAAGKRASGTVPLASCAAFSAVKLAPLIAGNVAGNRASGSVPLERFDAFVTPLRLPCVTVTAPVIFGNVARIVAFKSRRWSSPWLFGSLAPMGFVDTSPLI